MKFKVLKAAIAGIVLLNSSVASASLISTSDLYQGGDNLVINDLTSGADWLNTRATQNLSANDLLNGASDLMTVHGFRFATVVDLANLYVNLTGFTDSRIMGGDVLPGDEGTANIIKLVQAIGCTISCDMFDAFMLGDYSMDYFGAVYSRLYQNDRATMSLIVLNDLPGSVRLDTRTGVGIQADPRLGFWMVRGTTWDQADYDAHFFPERKTGGNNPSTEVNEPGTFAMFSLVLVVLAVRRRKVR
jgi:hypothetical protein